VIAIGDFDEEGIGDVDRVDLYIDVDFDESSVLFVGVGDEMDSGYVSEGGFIIWVYFVDFESVLEYLSLHPC